MYFKNCKIVCIFLVLLLLACEAKKEDKTTKEVKNIFVCSGMACWYGQAFEGKKTASGDVFRKDKFTAAHRYLQFGTFVRVTNMENNKKVKVEINDRGPFSKEKILDLSEKAAKEIELFSKGQGLVNIEICGYNEVNFSIIIKHFKNVLLIHQKERSNHKAMNLKKLTKHKSDI
jgi:rare lipoprotein A